MNTVISSHLEEIKNSPALDDELWIQLENLCETIKVVAMDINLTIEHIDGTCNGRIVETITQRGYQINTLADVIKEKIPYNDLIVISNIIYKLKNQLNDESHVSK